MKVWKRGWTMAVGVLLIHAFVGACADRSEVPPRGDPEWIHTTLKGVTDIMVRNIFNPPHASRTYAYTTIAAYEALRPMDSTYISMAGQLNDLGSFPEPEAGKSYYFPVASLQALLDVAEELAYARSQVQALQDQLEVWLHENGNGLSRDVHERSRVYGSAIARHVLDWADDDGYRETRAMPAYTLKEQHPWRWVPTPPAYINGIEPNWMHLRPFTLETPDQYRPEPPVPFDLEEGSAFRRELQAVLRYHSPTVQGEEREIASFWDCNPYTLHSRGHVMFATKQMTPGAHWVGIAGLAARAADLNMIETLEAYMLTSIALADGFISNWDEKYRSNLARPETLINKYIDENWMPVLQTPPFPEYTSGHSVISTASAEVLSAIHGDDFAYEDTVVMEYGLPARQFESFLAASEEAAISRLYGGIHYPMAINAGVRQGTRVGRHVLNHVQTRVGGKFTHVKREKPEDLDVLEGALGRLDG